MKVRFILVEPKVPENIGAAARAINVTGFDELVLVNPLCPLDGKALWVAHGSEMIIRSASVYGDLGEALTGSDFSVATTAKARSVFRESVESGDLHSFLSDRIKGNEVVSIVFGREESGLTNEEIKLCDISSYIPMKSSYPSINLAQAVMIYSYLLSDVTKPPGKLSEKEVEKDNKESPLHLLKEKTGNILNKIGIPEEDARFGRIMERLSYLRPSDVRLMLSVASRLENIKPE